MIACPNRSGPAGILPQHGASESLVEFCMRRPLSNQKSRRLSMKYVQAFAASGALDDPVIGRLRSRSLTESDLWRSMERTPTTERNPP